MIQSNRNVLFGLSGSNAIISNELKVLNTWPVNIIPPKACHSSRSRVLQAQVQRTQTCDLEPTKPNSNHWTNAGKKANGCICLPLFWRKCELALIAAFTIIHKKAPKHHRCRGEVQCRDGLIQVRWFPERLGVFTLHGGSSTVTSCLTRPKSQDSPNKMSSSVWHISEWNHILEALVHAAR